MVDECTADQINDLLVDALDAIILDVRIPQQFMQGHLAGAINIPVNSIESVLPKIAGTKRNIIVYCNRGNSSQHAISEMERLGFTNIIHMTKGLEDWNASRFELASSK